jgi:hypothetical protein
MLRMQPTPRAGEVEKLPEHIAQFDESFSGCRQRKNTFPGRAVGEVFLGLVPFFSLVPSTFTRNNVQSVRRGIVELPNRANVFLFPHPIPRLDSFSPPPPRPRLLFTSLTPHLNTIFRRVKSSFFLAEADNISAIFESEQRFCSTPEGREPFNWLCCAGMRGN